ncbi:hypothetical protein ACQEVF_25490 [Nonomuraea polychroma]|uniref:hypothetical protein n=1 Tax=Nonomuraea polychroma TaxID=46176 RepID=UPI003D8B7A88
MIPRRGRTVPFVAVALSLLAVGCAGQGEPEFTPDAGHFKISIRVLKKSCFGSAGCNITYRIVPSYTGPALPDDRKLTVTYEIRGGEEPKINSFEVEGDKVRFDPRELIQTPSSASTLDAVVTDVF